MSVQAGGETRSGIGTRLRAGRERKGYTVLQAAEKLHVDPKILESLESEDFDALGAPVYVRGHLRHYAELVGEQPAELQTLYSNTIRVTQPDLTRIPKGEAPSDPRRMAVPAVVVVLGFAIAGGVWWVVTLPKRQPHMPATPVAATTTSPPAAAPLIPVPSSPATSAAAESATPSASPVSVTARASATSRAPALPSPPVAKASGEAGSPPTAAPRAAREAQLTLRFNAESWAEVYDSGGERLFYDIAPAASVRTFKGTPPLRVVLGNAPGVAVEVNGKAADLANLTHSDGTAQFVVGRAGSLSPSQRP